MSESGYSIITRLTNDVIVVVSTSGIFNSAGCSEFIALSSFFGCFIDVNDDDSIKKKHWTKWNKDSMMNDPSAVKSRNTVSGMLDMDLLVWHCRSNLFHNLINLLNDTYWLYWHWFSLSNEENFHSNKVHQAWVYLVLLVVFCISKV